MEHLQRVAEQRRREGITKEMNRIREIRLQFEDLKEFIGDRSEIMFGVERHRRPSPELNDPERRR